jgi:LuxR family maltose regulon positive regulatory protein
LLAEDEMAVPLLKTKLYIPPVRPGLVSRPRLVERLDEGLRTGRKLTLISAPAGFGKTTLLSEWIAGCTGDVCIAWVSLDKRDNDPICFLTYLVAAVQAIQPDLGEGAWTIIQSPQPPAAEMVLTALINDLADRARPGRQVTPVVLVLDDCHEVTAEPVHDALVFLLDHLPPQMHVVMATRVDPPWPLGRLRARQEMTELRAGDLRFTPEETARFLNDVMRLGLSVEDMAALDRRTEGWIAGLQMAALSMRGRDAARAEAFIQAFSGSHRYVLDYLMEEVLDRQEDEIRAFLLQTSILDRLTAPLCDAVLAGEAHGASHSQSDSQAILTWLERTNLFLVPLDDERCWYRYHPLFADLLRRRLQDTYPEQVSENHLRASAWYEGQGSITDAISHALEAADDVRAAYLVERYSGQAFRYGEFSQHRRWVEALPEETVRSRPLLCMGRAWALADDPDATDRAVWWMERALALSATNPRVFDDPDSTYRTDHELISENARLFHISSARRQADPEEVITLCLEALEALSGQTLGEEAAFSRGIVTFWLAQAYGQLNDRDAAERAFAQAEQLGLAVEGHLVALAVAGAQAGDAWDRGDLHAVARICRETIASLIQPAEQAGERVPGACYAYVGLGSTLVEWNELGQAEPLLVRGVELAERVVEPGVQVKGCCALARLHWMQGNYEEAHAWMDKALQACRWDPSYLHALRARIWLAQGVDDPRWLDTAVQWADERVLEDPGEYSWELQSLVRVRITQHRAHGEPDLMPVLAVLDGHLEAPAAMSSGWLVEVLTLKALLLQALGRTEEAMPPLARALAIAEETGRVLAFLEHGSPMVDLLHEAVRQGVEASYARQILTAFEARGRAEVRQAEGRPSPAAIPSAQAALADTDHPIEPLSERELEVLRLLRSTLPQREIADTLYISINTVRSHVKHIYAKLGVHARIEAVARAEELGLL